MARTTKAKASAEKKEPEIIEADVAIETIEDAPVTATKIKASEIDPNQTVVVRNGFQGKLVYQSRKTGEVFEWDHFGDEQDIELAELRNARSSAKAFFEKNWFMFDEDWVIDYLGVGRYYKHALRIDEFDDLFKKSAKEVEEILSNLSDGQKRSVAYRARQLINEGAIDSNKVISALETGLGVELIER